MNPMDDLVKMQPATAMRPLLGQTVLAVEDSRFACEAIRLVCLRSGARVRRADCLQSARRHLRVYRPTIVLIDEGLPDGSGIELIEEVARAGEDGPIVLGISADDSRESAALEAGANGFLVKPLRSLAAFQNAVLSHLPKEKRPVGPRPVANDEIAPEDIAYRDDIAHARHALAEGRAAYVAQFIAGVAQSVADRALGAQAQKLAWLPESFEERRKLACLLEERLGERAAI
ncbi:MAG: response regulator [Pseudomonadota bacterium]